MSKAQETRECPYCKEEIRAEAVKCKHCGSRLTPERPSHEGVCPFCKEEIHPEAIKCKHCRSSLVTSSGSGKGSGGCGCGCDDSADASSAMGGFHAMSGWPTPQVEGASGGGEGSPVAYMVRKECGPCVGGLRRGTRICRMEVCYFDNEGRRHCIPSLVYKEDCATYVPDLGQHLINWL